MARAWNERELIKNDLWLLQILAIFLVVASAGPIPEALLGPEHRQFGGQPYYYTYPGAPYSPVGPANYPGQVVAIPGEPFFVEQHPTPFAAPSPHTDPLVGNPQNIQLLVSVPADVPPGTSVSVTVNVNAQPSGATIVSVSNPVVSPSPAPVSAALKPPTDAVVVDAIKGTL